MSHDVNFKTEASEYIKMNITAQSPQHNDEFNTNNIKQIPKPQHSQSHNQLQQRRDSNSIKGLIQVYYNCVYITVDYMYILWYI